MLNVSLFFSDDNTTPVVKFLNKSLLLELPNEALQLKCKTTQHVPNILKMIAKEVQKIKLFKKNFIRLERLEMAQFKNNW